MGGVERMMAAQVALLSERHEVAVASFDPPGSTPTVNLPVPLHALGGDRRYPLPLRPVTYLDQARRLAALERQLGVEVTISSLWRADLASALAARRGGPARISVAQINIADNPTNRALVRFRRIAGFAYRRLDAIVPVSRPLKDEFIALFGLDPAQLTPIPNFIDLAPMSPPRAEGPPRLVWCGRMVTEKNVTALPGILAALREQLPSVTLELIGDGPDRAEVEARAAAVGVPLTLHGRIDRPLEIMAGADLFVMPSRDEGLPVALLEALSLALPVAGADCAGGGIHEALGAASRHDPRRAAPEATGCGILLPVPETAAQEALWATAIAGLLTAQPAERQHLADAAHMRARQFSRQAVAARWHEVIAAALARRRM